MGVTINSRIIVELRLKQDWYGLRSNAFPATKKELANFSTFFKKGTIFTKYNTSLPSPEDDVDCVENEGPYGWMYKEEDRLEFAHMFSHILDDYRNYPGIFEVYE